MSRYTNACGHITRPSGKRLTPKFLREEPVEVSLAVDYIDKDTPRKAQVLQFQLARVETSVPLVPPKLDSCQLHPLTQETAGSNTSELF